MKTSFLSKKSGAGFALILTMCFLAVCLIVFASTMYWIMSSSKQTQRNEGFTTSEAAAEGATELVFAQMDRDYLYQCLNPVSSYTTLLPNQTGWPVQFVFSDTNGITGQISVVFGATNSTLQPLGAQYPGLLGYPQTNIIIATATPVGQLNNVSATVSHQFNFAHVPAFQFAIFYNINLEICPGQPMEIKGPVFCNASIWEGSANATYDSAVQAAGTNDQNKLDPFCSNYEPQSVPATFLLSGQPVSDYPPLIIPIGAGNPTNNNPTNVEAIINIPPSGAAAPQDIAYAITNLVYDFNAASLIVSNWYNGTNQLGGGYQPTGNNFTVYLQDKGPIGSSVIQYHWTQLTNDYYIVTNNKTWTTTHPYVTNTLFGLPGFTASDIPSFPWTASTYIHWSVGVKTNYGVMYAGFSFLTNVAFYDYRESATVQAVQIDVAALRSWITNSYQNGGSNWSQYLCQDTGKGINSIFAYNGVRLNTSQLPAVRLVNGQRLPNSTNYITSTNAPIVTSGLTVVTPQPLYVEGDYNVQIDGDGNNRPSALTHNTSHTYPAAFLADAITVLSTNWNDTNGSTLAVGSRDPVSTTVNAACLEGIVPSSGANYSGGVENFLRLLEAWNDTGVQLWYNGSIMVMFPSIYATNIWSGNYYGVPSRNWGFDTNFEVDSKLPPLTPEFRTVVRQTWKGY